MEFAPGDRVRKQSGYKFPGIVVGRFEKLDGSTRYVVECVAPGCQGILHIFNADQLVKQDPLP